jgi:cellulose synthase/poly-beta-1,6-N-acetylglucosamine synthase-like glycosyltransferase
MTDIEIPYEKDRSKRYRFFEILPGSLSWLLLFMPVILSFVNFKINGINVTLAVPFILAYLLIYFTRTLAVNIRALFGYRTMKHHMALNWPELVADLEIGKPTDVKIERPAWHLRNLSFLYRREVNNLPSELVHAVIVATVNESREVLEPTLQSIINADYDTSKMILVIAYEGRAGTATEGRVNDLIELYGGNFRQAFAVKHPTDIPGEVIGKGGNVTYAGRELQKYLEASQIDPAKVIVTTLDADNRPDRRYFSALTYAFCVVPNPLRASFQPLPMFTNNIWDAPAPMRVIATGNNFFYIVLTQRPHLERNFSAHAQSMRALIDMDFWSVRTIVEDGHHFWRSYFAFDGNYRVYPLSIPIYQDAVLADGYFKTLKAQFVQLRRWTYGASDIAYIANQGFFKPTKAHKLDVLTKFFRLLEGHVTWAVGAPLITFAAFIPALVHPQSFAANQLPVIVSRIQQLGLAGLFASLYVSMRTLPPRPARYRRHRSLFMWLQWLYLPITTICYGSTAAFYSQTRLMLGKYMSKFDVTEKASVSASGIKTTSDATPKN